MIRIGTICKAIPLLAAMALPAATQPVRIENGARFGGWTLSCEALAVNETLCVLTQRLVRSDDNSVLAEFVAFNDADAPGAWLVGRVPNGVYFPSGLVLGIEGGDRQIALDWQNCAPDLCEALLALTPEHLNAFDTEGPWVVGYRPGITAEALVFRISPAGLGEGLTALAAALGQPGPGLAGAAAEADDDGGDGQ